MFIPFYNKYRNLILYCLIGCVGASLDFCIFSLLVCCNFAHPQYVNIVSVSSGIITNFFLNYYFNFRSAGHLFFRLACFYLIGLFGLALSAFFLWLFITFLNMSAIAAKLCTIFFVTATQYTLNKLISFRKSKK